MNNLVKQEYDFWLQNAKEEEILQELTAVAENPKEIEDRFTKLCPLVRADCVVS